MPKPPAFKKQKVGSRPSLSISVTRDSLAGLRRDFEDFKADADKRIDDLEKRFTELRDLVGELERNAE
jgi:hypothetical protein